MHLGLVDRVQILGSGKKWKTLIQIKDMLTLNC